MYPGSWAAKWPDRPAIVMAESGESRTYAELDAASNQLAHYFRQIGLTRGGHVAVLMANCPELLEVTWAAQRSGLYYTPLNWHLTESEIAYILDDCEAKLLVIDHAHASLGASLLVDRPWLRGLILGGSARGLASHSDVVANLPTSPISDEAEGQDMIYTSGTTGKPKGGIRALTSQHPASTDDVFTKRFRMFTMDSDTVYLSPGAPLYHAAPLRFAMTLHRLGGTAIIMTSFDPLGALEAIQRYSVTHSQWVPTMFVRMLRCTVEEREQFDLSSHKVALHSAAPCAPSVKRQMLDWWGPIIFEYYSASEGGGISFIGPEDWLAHPGSVGRAAYGYFHILDEDENEVPPNVTGVVYSERGLSIAYHNDREKTDSVHSRQGWSTSGDLGYLNEEGYLYLVGRRSNLIISGGVNIYPQEIEDILVGHPAVGDVAVVGIPNAEYGEEVKAIVETVDASMATPELAGELIAYCKERLAAYKCPRSIDFDRELPRGPNGKLYKQTILERFWKDSNSVTQ
jgi:long-chain acyl-CoA synthetase